MKLSTKLFFYIVCDENLPEWNIAVIALAVIFFIIGVGIAVILGMLLFFVARKSVGRYPSSIAVY